jgi:hypothetical protein
MQDAPSLSLAGAAVVLLGTAGAQAPIAPKSFATVEGLSGSSLPFGTNQPVRFQCIYDNEDLPFSGPVLVRGVGIRANHDHDPNLAFAQKEFFYLHVLVSTTSLKAVETTTEFSRNHGRDLQQVLTGGRISLPPQPAQPVGPRPCNVRLPFQTPVFFDLTPYRLPGQRPSSFVLDLLVEISPNTQAYDVDTPFLCSSQIVPFGVIGPQCVTSRGTPRRHLTIASSDSVKAGGSITFTVGEMPDQALFGVMIGTTDTGTWRGLTLPVDLTPLGAAGCYVLTDWIHTAVAVGDSTGQGRASFSIPSGREFVGGRLYAQAICRDLSSNPLFYVTSLGVRTTVCGPVGVARIFALGDHAARYGQRTYGSGLIVEFL